MTTQAAFLARVEQLAESADLDVRIDFLHANTGSIRFSYRGDLTPISLVTFDFQTGWGGYAVFTLSAPGTRSADWRKRADYNTVDLEVVLAKIWEAIRPMGSE